MCEMDQKFYVYYLQVVVILDMMRVTSWIVSEKISTNLEECMGKSLRGSIQDGQ
jgi:hypothetical protein